MRILHIIGKMDRAGAETMLMNLYRVLDKEKYQFDFVVFTKNKGDYDDEIVALGGRIIPILGSNSFTRMYKLYRFLKKNKQYRIVHAHTLLSNAFHILASKLANVPTRISHSHNTEDASAGKLYKFFAKSIIKNNATAFVSCGKAASKFLYGNENSIILPNAVNTDELLSISYENQDYIREKLNIRSNLIIVQIARFEEVKNHFFSLELAKRLSKKNIDFKMLFAGKGKLENELKTIVYNNNLEDKVEFLGLRRDVTALLAGADIMIMPSLFEGFPVVLVESQAIGRYSFISDHISREVDLGLNLVGFLELDVDKWVDCILNYQKRNIEYSNIKLAFNKTGFDIHVALKKLLYLYNR